MNVGFVTSSYPTTSRDARGIHIHRLASALVRQGVSVHVVAPSDRPETYLLDDVEVHPVRMRASRPGHIAAGVGGILPNLKRNPSRWLEVPGLLWGLRKAVNDLSDLDVLHAHWLIPSGWAAAFSKLRTPLVVTAHGSDVNVLGRFKLGRWELKRIIERSDHVVGVSRNVTKTLLGLGSQPSKTSTLSVGVPTRRPKQFRESEGPLQLLYVGALTESKSVGTLLLALAELEDRDMCRLRILGDGPSREGLQKDIRSLELRNVDLSGAVPPNDVEEWMSRADVLVLPSLSEGTPAAVMEAMAAGLAVVASDIPGTRDLLRHGVSGLLFPAGSHRDLASSIQQLVDDRELAIRLGAAAKQAVSDLDLDLESIAREYVEIYESLRGEPK